MANGKTAEVFIFPVIDTAGTPRPIQTVYYRGRDVVRVNRGKWANSAVLRCVDHMQLNSYEATTAEVYDGQTGVLHAVITHNVQGVIKIIFKREVNIHERD